VTFLTGKKIFNTYVMLERTRENIHLEFIHGIRNRHFKETLNWKMFDRDVHPSFHLVSRLSMSGFIPPQLNIKR
jgi:hypothetical protein